MTKYNSKFELHPTPNSGCPSSMLLRSAIAPHLARIGLGDLHAQDLQNCLCEFDKYAKRKPEAPRNHGKSDRISQCEHRRITDCPAAPATGASRLWYACRRRYCRRRSLLE